ncbi:hypothetical protein LSH36_1061g00003 [Paralvinella palmiformis]|uniref:Saposin B-type domain-containing protein n=1 Tax=Paralvinella palmiformis TaxID=53620 RepID=A0AAD9IVW2_9ANNE|nr:hypothetical protein LSH36_1061g00003 [Paralvinella palmiformis]
MKTMISSLCLFTLIAITKGQETSFFRHKGVNGGIPCAGCTFVVGLIEQLAQVHNRTIMETVDDLCDLLPQGVYHEACTAIIHRYGPVVIDLLYAKITPDLICHGIRFCYVDPGKHFCNLFPLPTQHSSNDDHTARMIKMSHTISEKYLGKQELGKFPDVCQIPGIKFICNVLNRPKHSDKEMDSNCNGIYGVDIDGVPYEDKFCKNSSHLGIGILGDSAAAHFHIPEEWLMASRINKELLKHLPFVIENEFDWPMMSAATGAKWTNLQYYQKQISRNQMADYPMLLFYSLVGNDVCNGFPDTVTYMTTPKQMRENVMNTLKYLDTRLPKGSHLVFIGLADGRVLYNSMYWRYHPFGEINKDVKYPDFYEYLKCLEISPCNGWMTSNDTQRELTYKRVVELNNVLRLIAVNYRNKFDNFDIIYLDCPLMPVLQQWEKIHGKNTGYQLIEPVDGFHPNQYAMVLTAQYTWDLLSLMAPHMLTDVNPHNKEIENIFGDQGGY